MDTEPSDEELCAFVDSVLSEPDRLLREPDVIAESVREHREMWLLLYRVSQGFELPDS